MKMAELKMLPVSVLKPAAYNPRKKLKKGDKEYKKIENSIREFGFADPLVVNADMTIIGGHQRLTVAIDLGYTEVPCAVVDVDKTREKALNIALNKITGAWDDQMLADLGQILEVTAKQYGFIGYNNSNQFLCLLDHCPYEKAKDMLRPLLHLSVMRFAISETQQK